MSNWIVETMTYDGDIPVVKPTDLPAGKQGCGCCFVFSVREEAKQLELSLLREWQKRIQAELAECENHIVTVMRELNK